MERLYSSEELAERYQTVVKDLGVRADDLVARLEKIAVSGVSSMDAHTKVLDDLEAGVKEIEDLTNQISNGGPPLGDSSPGFVRNEAGVMVNQNK